MTSHLFNQHLPQALLLLGAEHTRPKDIVEKLITHTLCESPEKNCGHCRACQLIKQNIHPDITWITPEKAGAAIKIDQIRTLQQEIYQTPQCASSRIIVLHPADELNRAAANALLKILEEPPQHAHFILIAHHLSTLPATIMSRCHIHRLKAPNPISNQAKAGYLALGLYYSDDTPRGVLFKNHETIMHQICDLSLKKTSVCKLASTYTEYQLQDILWFLHLFTASLIQHQLQTEKPVFSSHAIQQLAEKHPPVHYFKQLDMILSFTKKINQDIPLNPTLTLETLLIGYL